MNSKIQLLHTSTIKSLILLFVFTLSFTSLSAEARQVFKSSFDGVSIDTSISYAHKIKGLDTVTGYSWASDLPGDGERNYFNYVIPSDQYANYLTYVETRIDSVTVPNSSATKALYIEYKQPGGGLPTRNMYDMFPIDDLNDPVNRFDKGYIKEKIKIDWETTGTDWIDFWEIKSQDEGYRFGLYMANVNTANPSWAVICLDNYTNKWRDDNYDVPVKKNEWFEIEVYWEVIDETKGIFKFAVDGVVVFDKVEILTARRNVPFYFMPFKAYGAKNRQWITDFEYWDQPPVTSVLSPNYDPSAPAPTPVPEPTPEPTPEPIPEPTGPWVIDPAGNQLR